MPASTPGPFNSGVKNLRGCTGVRSPVPPSVHFHSKSQDCSEALGAAPAAKLPDAEPIPPVTPRERVTIADIKERRAKAGRLVAPTAAYSDADMFKAPVCAP
jgi:aromatic amino acid aminotransferase I